MCVCGTRKIIEKPVVGWNTSMCSFEQVLSLLKIIVYKKGFEI